MNIVRSDQEIWDLLNQCAEVEETGSSNYPGMSYEQGIKVAIEWIIGDVKKRSYANRSEYLDKLLNGKEFGLILNP